MSIFGGPVDFVDGITVGGGQPLMSATSGALTLYVDPTGNDANPGTSPGTAAKLTIQAAINAVPKIIRHSVTINVAAGNYAGAFIDGFDTQFPADPTTNFSGLHIRGTMVAVTPATGTNSGTLTGYTASNGGEEAIPADSVQAWTVDNLKGKYMTLLSGTGFPGTEQAPSILPIISNTGTTVTVRGPATAIGATYQLQEPGTVIDSGVTPIASSGSLPGYPFGSKTGLVFGNNTGGAIGVSRIKLSVGTNLPNGTRGTGPSGVRFLVVTCSGPSGVTAGINTNNLTAGALDIGATNLTQCVVQIPGVSGIIFGVTSAQHTVQNSFLEGVGGTGTGITIQGGKTNVSGVTLKGLTRGLLVNRDIVGGCIFSGAKIDSCTTGIDCPNDFSINLGQPGCSINVATSSVISNCVTGVNMATPLSLCWVNSCSGTGNTTLLKVAQGGKIKVAAVVTATGTTEISADGVADTLAAMRARTPKTTVPNNYGSLVYE